MKKYYEYELNKNEDSYEWALLMSGVKILAFETFGSYQGDWIAKIEHDGKIWWLKEGYGSCSGCDAWEASDSQGEKTKQEWKEFCEDFIKSYLTDIKTYDEIIKECEENIEWDMDAKEMVNFVKKNK